MKNVLSILIVDDEPQLRELLRRLLTVEGFEVDAAEDIQSALKKLEDFSYYVLLLDVRLPDGNGVELVKTLKEKYPETEIILFTAYGSISDGVNGIKNGAFDYLVKGDDNNKIIPLVNKAIEKARAQFQLKVLNKKNAREISFDAILAKSVLTRNAISLARKVAPTDASVLLTGPTGTGKEIMAQALHNNSHRSAGAFVRLSCALLSKDSIESELFGFKAGTFPWANRDKVGLLEEANKGTLFLDEIGEMSLELQAKLFRFLETGEYFKSGDSKVSKSDVRIISSTNRDIKKEIERNAFRGDLFFRINTVEIKLPSLSERKEDIAPLTDHFVLFYSSKLRKRIKGYTDAFLEKLKQNPWPGNVRELRTTIERACILCEKDKLDIDTLPLDFILNNSGDSSLNLAEVEKNHIVRVLHLSKGHKTKTAELLGIGLSTLYRKIDEYDIHVS